MEYEGLKLLFKKTGVTPTDIFLYIFDSEAAKAESDPHREVLDRYMVETIFLNKVPTPPEHEYLLIEVRDTLDNDKTTLFILDRCAA